MNFKLTILGSSSALPTSSRFPAAHVLNVHERLFLIDCGEGTQIQLRRFKLKLGRLEAIFISHIHGDHTLGLFGLISTLNLLGRTDPLTVYAPKELKEILFANINFFIDNLSYRLDFHPVDTTVAQTIRTGKHVSVSTVPLNHRVPAVGYRFDEVISSCNIRKDFVERYRPGIADIARIKAGSDFIAPDGTVIPNADITYNARLPRSYAYCSDTLYSERLTEAVKGVDLLYHEATFMDSEIDLARATGHSTARQAALIARKAGVGRLLIGHFSARYKSIDPLEREARSVFTDTFAVADGQSFGIPEKKIPPSS